LAVATSHQAPSTQATERPQHSTHDAKDFIKVAPCAQIYIVLELTHGGEIIGWLVCTGRGTGDVAHCYYCHLISDSDGDSLDCFMWLSHHLTCGMAAMCGLYGRDPGGCGGVHLGNGGGIRTSSLLACDGITGSDGGVGDLGHSSNNTIVGAHGMNGDGGSSLDAHGLGGGLVGDGDLSVGSHGMSEHCNSGGDVAIGACGPGSGLLNIGEVMTGVGNGDGIGGPSAGANNDAWSMDSSHDIVGCDGNLLGALRSSTILDSGG
jgi:hypothetical protein